MKFEIMSVRPEGKELILLAQFDKFRFAELRLKKQESVEDSLEKICEFMHQIESHYKKELQKKLQQMEKENESSKS